MDAMQLKAALKKCSGGETIDLNGADLGYTLLPNFKFGSAVTIANGSLGFSVRGCQGIIFDTVDLAESLAGYGSNAIAIRRSHVLSGAAMALQFHNIADGFVEDCEFSYCQLALALRGTSRFRVTGNKFHDIKKDGIRIQEGADTVMIDGNDFWDFYPGEVGGEATHPDAIQGATDAKKPSRNIMISNNRIWRGKGQAVQGIFCRTYAGRINYEALSIRRNFVQGTLYNGIAFTGEGDVTDNTLLAAPDQKTWMRSSNLAAFRGNLAPLYHDGSKLVAPPKGNGVIA